MISTDLFIPSRNQSLDDDDRDRSLSLCVAAESSLDDEWFSKLHSEYVAYPWAQWKCSDTSRFADCHKSKCQERDGHKAKTNFFLMLSIRVKGISCLIYLLRPVLLKTIISQRDSAERDSILWPLLCLKRGKHSLCHMHFLSPRDASQ